MNKLIFALKLLKRDWRAGELFILALALIIAVASTTTINMFSDRLNRTMVIRAAEFLAADLVVTSHSNLPDSWINISKQSGLEYAKIAEFASVLINQDELLLSGIKATSTGYPLRGYLKTTITNRSDEIKIYDIPIQGEAWVDRRVLATLGLSLGDHIEVGEKRLKLSRILTYEPDRKGNFSSLSPRVMINYLDLAATGAVRPGSHVHHYLLFAGAEQQIREFKKWLKPQLNPGQRLLDIHEDRPELGTALSRAENYLGLSSIIVVMIAGVAIAMATRRYSERHFEMSGLLRCLGAKQRDIVTLFSAQLIVLSVVASFVGCAIGWLGQESLAFFLKDLLPQHLVQPGWYGLSSGILTGLIVLIGFALPPIIRQKFVSPLKVFRKELEPPRVSVWLVYGFALTAVVVLMAPYMVDMKMMFYIVFVGLLSTAVLTVITLGLIKLSQSLRPWFGLAGRIGLQNLSRHPKSSISQVLAFSVTLTAMVVIVLVRTDLINTWQTQLPDDTPNYFALNIFPDEWQSFKVALEKERFKTSEFYPIVRGRLVQINDIDVYRIVRKESSSERAINRDLSLTTAELLPNDNKIVKGRWWLKESEDSVEVSVEEGLAASLNIQLGDTLTFTIGSQRLDATATSIRNLRWDSMKPNFYIIFSPGTLDKYPSTYLSSFYLPPANKLVLNRLLKTFPNITVLEIDLILNQFRMILNQVSLAIEYVLIFALIAGFLVLFAAVHASIDERNYESVILRTFGASKRLIRTSQLTEFFGLGLMAGILAAATAQIITWIIYTITFNLDYAFKWEVWLITPITGALIIGIAGMLSTRSVVNKSPLIVLRDL